MNEERFKARAGTSRQRAVPNVVTRFALVQLSAVLAIVAYALK